MDAHGWNPVLEATHTVKPFPEHTHTEKLKGNGVNIMIISGGN